MFAPLTTERLLLRAARRSDVDALFARRNDPEVALLQDWETPYPRERAEGLIAGAAATTDPVDDEWFMLTVEDRVDSTVHGDLVFKLEDDGRTAEVGATFARQSWSHGYATEALTVVLGWLFDVQGVSRAHGMLHPDNERSARVLENCGFVFEGHLRNSYWLGNENSDDLIYGLTPERRAQWLARPRTAPDNVELVEPYPTGLRHVVTLGTHHSQERFVTPLVISLAQVAVPPYEEGFDGNPGDPRVVPWPRIIHADGQPVGFVMMVEPTEANPQPYLWRLLIDRMHQRRGIGKRVVQMVIDQARAWGADSLTVSYGEGIGSPEPLYRSFGFVPTGEMDEDEVIARLTL